MRFTSFALLLAAVLLLFPGATFARYTENLTVQVVDQALRPVEGAQVYVEYELNSVKGNVKTKPKATGADGLANIIFTDYEEITSETNYAYTIFVKYGSQLTSASLIASEDRNQTIFSSRIYTMPVESYLAYIRVIDQKGKPLSASVTIGSEQKQTDAGGSARFSVPPGNYTLKVEREDLVKNVPLLLDASIGDKTLDVVLSYYTLDVAVQDDRRRPLPASVEVNGAQAQTDSEGIAHFENITTDSPSVIVAYGQGIKRVQPLLQSSSKIEVTFDISKPSIRDAVSSLSSSGVGTVRFFVDDSGPDASGIDTVSVSYSVAGIQNPLSVYAVGYGTYEAKIPAQPAGTLVKYTISVADKEGNTVQGLGEYVVPSAGSSGDPNLPPTPPPSQQLPNEAIFVGIAAIAILAFGAIYYFNKRKGGRIEPPVLPPQMPQQ